MSLIHSDPSAPLARQLHAPHRHNIERIGRLTGGIDALASRITHRPHLLIDVIEHILTEPSEVRSVRQRRHSHWSRASMRQFNDAQRSSFRHISTLFPLIDGRHVTSFKSFIP